METIGLAFLGKQRPDQGNPYDDLAPLQECIHQSLLQSGLGKKDSSIPFADIIKPGMTVLIKPNWVSDRNENGETLDCLITNANFIIAALKEVLAAKPGRIIIGDAPIQGCVWDNIVTVNLMNAIEGLKPSCPVQFIDFRRTILKDRTLMGGVLTEVRPNTAYALFDLGKESLLEPISGKGNKFRITMYNPSILSQRHGNGKHQYLICSEAFDANVIINLPKLKVHRKAGLTGGLKNMVGLNGNKEYLPHHRIGGSWLGGDCYRGIAPIKRLVEWCLDCANLNIGLPTHRKWIYYAYRLLGFHKRLFGEAEIEGGWYGNDTVWRMVLDINRIALYGCKDGSMADKPQRVIWTLTDAIICGEKEGPLSPSPAYLGIVSSSGSPVAADMTHASLLRLDYNLIPLIREALSIFKWPLATRGFSPKVKLNGEEYSLKEIGNKIGIPVQPPNGWIGRCELKG